MTKNGLVPIIQTGSKTGANKRNRAVADQGLVWWRPGDRSYRCVGNPVMLQVARLSLE